MQSLADRTRNVNGYEAYLELKKEIKKLYGKLRRHLLHLVEI